jgi:hypothetical protein
MKPTLLLTLVSLATFGAFGQTKDGSAPRLDYVGTISAITALPCAVGQRAFATNATAGQNIYLCTATNTWTQLTGGGGGGSLVMTTGSGAPVATCTAPSSSNLAEYVDTTNQNLWVCIATNTWQQVVTAGTGQVLITGAEGSALVAPSSGNLTCGFVTSTNQFQCITSGSTISSAVQSMSGATPGQYVQWIGADGVQHLNTPGPLASLDLPTQSAAISATALYTPTTTQMVRVSYYAKVTTPGTSTGTLGGTTGFALTYTDGTDSVAQTANVLPEFNQAGANIAIGTGNTTNTTQATLTGSAIVWAKTGVGMTYAFGYGSTGGTAMVYELHIRVEGL